MSAYIDDLVAKIADKAAETGGTGPGPGATTPTVTLAYNVTPGALYSGWSASVPVKPAGQRNRIAVVSGYFSVQSAVLALARDVGVR